MRPRFGGRDGGRGRGPSAGMRVANPEWPGPMAAEQGSGFPDAVPGAPSSRGGAHLATQPACQGALPEAKAAIGRVPGHSMRRNPHDSRQISTSCLGAIAAMGGSIGEAKM